MKEVLIKSKLFIEITKCRNMEREGPLVTKPSPNDVVHQKEMYIQAKVYFWRSSANFIFYSKLHLSVIYFCDQ